MPNKDHTIYCLVKYKNLLSLNYVNIVNWWLLGNNIQNYEKKSINTNIKYMMDFFSRIKK